MRKRCFNAMRWYKWGERAPLMLQWLGEGEGKYSFFESFLENEEDGKGIGSGASYERKVSEDTSPEPNIFLNKWFLQRCIFIFIFNTHISKLNFNIKNT